MKKLKSCFLFVFLLALAAGVLAACGKKDGTDLPPLGKPANVRRDDTFMVWNEVENATGYTVEIDGVSYDCAEAKFDLSVLTEPADYIIKVKANGDGKAFSDSAWVSRGYKYAGPMLVFDLIGDGSAYAVTKCNSTNNGAVEIPAIYNGKPVTAIAEEVFRDNTQLISVTVPNSVTEIGHAAFFGCSSLTDVQLSIGLETIGPFAFCSCTSLTAVQIPESVTTVKTFAFMSCTSLTDISLPEGVATIESLAFNGCTTLTSIVLPESVTTMGGSVFLDCSALTDVTLPQGLKTLPSSAFKNCTSLANIKLPENITTIESYAFQNCTALTGITLPKNITTIGYSAFDGCTELANISIPDSVSKIGDDAFRNTAWYQNQADGEVYIGNVLYVYKGTVPQYAEITVRKGTTYISSGAFNGQAGLAKIVLPAGIEVVEKSTFENCYYLSEIVLPETLTEIGTNAFKNCYKLASITLPQGLKIINDGAFISCTFKEITIPQSVQKIGYNVFGISCQKMIFEDVAGWKAKESTGELLGVAMGTKTVILAEEDLADSVNAAKLAKKYREIYRDE